MLSALLLILNLAYAQVVIIDDFSSPRSHGYKVKAVLQKEFQGEIITLPVENYSTSLKQVLEIKPLVLNLSFGTSEYSGEEIELLKQISNQGTYIVVAAGNSNQKVNNANPVYPCFYPIENLMCVGASEGLTKAVFSNFGPKVKLFTNGFYQGENVTSFAAPRVSAFIAASIKCHNDPMDLIHRQAVTIEGQEVSLLNEKADSYCYKYSVRDPF